MKHLLILLIVMLTFTYCSLNDPGNETPGSEITVKYVYPENNETDIPVNHMFIFQFDQDIYFVDFTNNISITKENGTKISYTFNAYIDNPTNLFLIKPSNLEPGTRYIITIDEGIRSANGKSKLQKKLSHPFITRTAPNQVDNIKAGYTKLVATQNLVTLYYDEHLNPLHITEEKAKIQNSGYSAIFPSTVEYDFQNRAILFHPNALLQTGFDYDATVNWDVADLAGNTFGLSGIASHPFTIE